MTAPTNKNPVNLLISVRNLNLNLEFSNIAKQLDDIVVEHFGDYNLTFSTSFLNN